MLVHDTPAESPSAIRGARTDPAPAALSLWALTRVATLAVSWAAMYVTQLTLAPRSWLGEWRHWDAGHLANIARYGYFGPGALPHDIAYFPGYPMAMWVVHLLVPSWTVSGLLVSLIAGAFAVTAMARLAEDYTPGTGRQAVLFLLVSPAAVFLAAAYAESLFLAFALPAWLAARKQRWVLAGVLAGAACAVRVNGLFLIAALVLAAVLSGRQRWRALAGLAPALVPPLAYEAYLRLATGDWLAWLHAEAAGWGRHFTSPITSWDTTWGIAFGQHMVATGAWEYQLEIASALIGTAAAIALAATRHWPEAAYCALTVGALVTSTWYESIPRALLLLWPVWWGLARLAQRRPWIGQVWLAVSVPAACLLGFVYLTGGWAG